MTTPLPCGCVRGSYLCAEAESLWRNANNSFHSRNPNDEKYWRDMYEAHFEQDQEATRD